MIKYVSSHSHKKTINKLLSSWGKNKLIKKIEYKWEKEPIIYLYLSKDTVIKITHPQSIDLLGRLNNVNRKITRNTILQGNEEKLEDKRRKLK